MKEMQDHNELVRQQFNRQAERFSSWSCTQDLELLDRYFDFCGLTAEDTLLDVACGSGELANYYADRVKSVCGVDISEGMITLARDRAVELGLKNTQYVCHDVESLPFTDASFSFIICKSAFHHMNDYLRVFTEVVRCCEPGGRISTQDIMAYEDPYVDSYFESFEKAVDISHHRTLSDKEFQDAFDKMGLESLRTFSVEVELDLAEYLEHAEQSKKQAEILEDLLASGSDDPVIKDYFVEKDGRQYFRRKAFLVLGKKPASCLND